MNDTASIDLILPTLNPPTGWAESTTKKKEQLERLLDCPVHLIVSDDGSEQRKEIKLLAKMDASVSVISSDRNHGKGAALRRGATKAESDIIVFTDADFPYELASIKAIVDSIRSGTDVALGYREQNYYASVPWFRKGLSEGFRFVLKSILKFPITDTQCGLKGMNQTGKSILLKTKINRFLVDMEFIKLGVRSNARIEPVIVELRPNVVFSSMGISTLLRELINFVRVLIM